MTSASALLSSCPAASRSGYEPKLGLERETMLKRCFLSPECCWGTWDLCAECWQMSSAGSSPWKGCAHTTSHKAKSLHGKSSSFWDENGRRIKSLESSSFGVGPRVSRFGKTDPFRESLGRRWGRADGHYYVRKYQIHIEQDEYSNVPKK